MKTFIIEKLMAFKDIFKDHNDYNEKSIIGFISFLMMIVTLIVDLIAGWMGRDFTLHQFVFDGFLFLTIGAFGIASLDKYISLKNSKDKSNTDQSPFNDSEVK